MKKNKVILKYCGRKPSEHQVDLNGRVVENFVMLELASDLCLLFRKNARDLGHSFNANICGVDFYGTVIFVGRTLDKLTDISLSIEKLKILFPDLFLEE